MNPNLCSNSLYPSLTFPSLPSVPLLSVPLPFALPPTSGTHRYVLISLVHGQDQKSGTATRYHSETGGVFLLFPPCTLSLNTSHLPAISSPAPYWPLLPVILSDFFYSVVILLKTVCLYLPKWLHREVVTTPNRALTHSTRKFLRGVKVLLKLW